MSDVLEDLKKCAELLRQHKPLAWPFDSVENHDGLAVFKHGGRTVGWMNWGDFEAVCNKMEGRK